jgi:DNA-binding NarL/FixJ family response regulator
MSATTKINVAIVEDNSAIGTSLQKIIETSENLHFVGLWNHGEEALKKIDAFRPHVILMDINLPDISGIEVTARIKKQTPEIKIIMITVYRDHDKIFASLKAGASGYLLKRSTTTAVRAAIHDVFTGGAPLSAEIARRIVDSFHQPTSANSDDLNLSKRETEILEQLCVGLANKEIADRLGISFETVRVHLKNIFEKLHVRSRTEAAVRFLNAREHVKWRP